MVWKFGRLEHPDTPIAMDAELYHGDLLHLGKYPCGWCDEPILPRTEAGFVLPYVDPVSTRFLMAYHEECFIRTAVGSLAHQQFLCSCYVKDSHLEDPPGMTKRQAARVAMNSAFGLAV